MSSLFPALTDGPGERSKTGVPPDEVWGRTALRFGPRSLTYGGLAGAAGALAARIEGSGRVAVWATAELETAVAVTGALLAGVAAVPLNPKSGERELAHILSDSAPSLVLAAPGVELPPVFGDLARIEVDASATGAVPQERVSDGDPALIVYTSGTTGPPKGAVLPRRALATTLDALADAWRWTGDDVLVHGLPLFHVHGLVLGVLGPLRRGGSVRHLGRFSPEGVARELNAGATMVFGVPTMYHRIAEALPGDPELAKALAGARLLVSGSAALPVHDHERIAAATGRRVIERYGMTETLMNTSVRADGEARAGTVGVPLPGVELRLVEEDGTEITAYDGESVGEIQVRGPNLFTEYLNRPDATAAAFTADGWFRTGDMAVREPDGYVRIVGRKATDLIKSGGYKIGAGEIENALLEHPGVREAAVTGEPDADLGERIVAWIVPADPETPPGAEELADHVARRLAPHKRPRVVRYLQALPRNDMGKIMKRALSDA
ncbi:MULTISPECIES: acyl-CoA synthetase [unclassified Streptomyces]|uniref:acyl-CoA synthetase n=1 Tax=unclassified Streptomyces TaxID=2593676 RepID=UPI0004CB8DEB|nr:MULTISPECIES: acyl-CoA synthetase [unclassified Streptomyces]